MELMKEEQRKKIEALLEQAVSQAKTASVELEELTEMLRILYEEQS